MNALTFEDNYAKVKESKRLKKETRDNDMGVDVNDDGWNIKCLS